MRIGLAVAVSLATVVIGQSAHGQGFDGRWQGTYSCGAHVSLPMGPFTWSLQVDVQNGAITSRHDYRISTRGNIPATANFNGSIDGAGNARVNVIAADANSVENYHQTLVGRIVSPNRIQLSGPMLGREGKPLRNCSLALNLIAPPHPVVATQDADQERQRLEAQKQAATAREQKAIERQKAAEAARTQAEEEQRKALEAQQVATVQANQDKDAAIAAQKKADAERQAAEAALHEAETMKEQALAELQAAQAQKEAADNTIKEFAEKQEIAVATDLAQLPKTENAKDWIPWQPRFPIQERQFCSVVEKFNHDLEQAKADRNEIQQNQLKKARREDLQSLIPEGVVDSWVVHAVEVRQTDDGSAATILQIPCHVLIGTYLGPDCKNPAQFEGVIKQDSPLYREFAKFKYRDFVLVSGKLLAVNEPEAGHPLPSYRYLAPGTYCTRAEGGKDEELFVIDLKSIFKLVPLASN